MSQAGLARLTTGSLPPSIVVTITGNDGVPESAVANNFNIVTANATPKFVGSAGTETIDFGIENLVLGSSMPVRTVGNFNTGLGNFVLKAVTSANSNTAVGNRSCQLLDTGGINTAIGDTTLSSATSTVSNVCVGFGSLAQLSTAIGRNTALGTAALGAINTGSDNIGVGYQVGSQYLNAESNNIVIGNIGVIGESNVMRLGTQGTGTRQQTQTYIAGVINTVSGRVVNTTVPLGYPYTTLTTDYVILIDTGSARTINLISSPVTGTTYRIKDNVGSAAANNITVTPAAGTIDGAASLIINSNWGSVDVVYNGTSWRVL